MTEISRKISAYLLYYISAYVQGTIKTQIEPQLVRTLLGLLKSIQQHNTLLMIDLAPSA
jgi:hypothetical protein